MIPTDNLAYRTLVTVARQRDGLDEGRCRLVLEFLGTAKVVGGVLKRKLAELGLTEPKFAVLVVLFALDPAAVTPADLATHTGATRSAMTDALDALEAHALAVRRRDTQDRRLVYVQLTDAGRAAANDALMHYLQTADRLAGLVSPSGLEALRQGCARLHEGAARFPVGSAPVIST